jgi:hypothetical protein
MLCGSSVVVLCVLLSMRGLLPLVLRCAMRCGAGVRDRWGVLWLFLRWPETLSGDFDRRLLLRLPWVMRTD